MLKRWKTRTANVFLTKVEEFDEETAMDTEPPVVLVEDGLSPTQLPAQVLGLGTNYLSYVISFLVLAVYWQAHHRVFRPIRG